MKNQIAPLRILIGRAEGINDVLVYTELIILQSDFSSNNWMVLQFLQIKPKSQNSMGSRPLQKKCSQIKSKPWLCVYLALIIETQILNHFRALFIYYTGIIPLYLHMALFLQHINHIHVRSIIDWNFTLVNAWNDCFFGCFNIPFCWLSFLHSLCNACIDVFI